MSAVLGKWVGKRVGVRVCRVGLWVCGWVDDPFPRGFLWWCASITLVCKVPTGVHDVHKPGCIGWKVCAGCLVLVANVDAYSACSRTLSRMQGRRLPGASVSWTLQVSNSSRGSWSARCGAHHECCMSWSTGATWGISSSTGEYRTCTKRTAVCRGSWGGSWVRVVVLLTAVGAGMPCGRWMCVGQPPTGGMPAVWQVWLLGCWGTVLLLAMAVCCVLCHVAGPWGVDSGLSGCHLMTPGKHEGLWPCAAVKALLPSLDFALGTRVLG
jgi:hypothetical protein